MSLPPALRPASGSVRDTKWLGRGADASILPFSPKFHSIRPSRSTSLCTFALGAKPLPAIQVSDLAQRLLSKFRNFADHIPNLVAPTKGHPADPWTGVIIKRR